MTTIIIPLNNMQSLSQQKRKLKKNLKDMQMILKDPITVKTTTRKEIITNEKMNFHSRKIRMEELLHQEDPSQPGIKISFLVIVFFARILVTRKQIANLIEEMII